MIVETASTEQPQPRWKGCGTIFKITPNGTLTVLHTFDVTDGSIPVAGLIQGTDGNFYGTTSQGGNLSACNSSGCGTIFKMTSGGALTTLYSFCAQMNCADGSGPTAGLVQATDGNFYGTTSYGGSSTACTGGCGMIFRITPAGVLTTLHSFDVTDGAQPSAGLVQATSGAFYGTTFQGGSYSCVYYSGCGTIFRLSVGLGRFVETLPTSGKVGTTIKILGSDLKGCQQRHLQRYPGNPQSDFTVRDRGHRAVRRHNRSGSGDDANWHTFKQRAVSCDSLILRTLVTASGGASTVILIVDHAKKIAL